MHQNYESIIFFSSSKNNSSLPQEFKHAWEILIFFFNTNSKDNSIIINDVDFVRFLEAKYQLLNRQNLVSSVKFVKILHGL